MSFSPITIKDETGTVRLKGSSSGGGGGSSSLLKFPIAFGDAGLNAGIAKWTPTVDSWLLDAWFDITEAWNGTTPLGDIGVISDGQGLFGNASASGAAGAIPMDTSLWQAFGGAFSFIGDGGSGQTILSVAALMHNNIHVPCFVAAHTQVAVWVSQDGTPGGASPAASQGAAILALSVAPVG
jgi:hypothetical protein